MTHIYNKSDQYYEKDEGEFSLCACMGAVYGEPFCPCQMCREGLPLSEEHAEKLRQFKMDIAEFYKKLVGQEGD